MTFTPHPKGAPKAKKPGAMKTKPKSVTKLRNGASIITADDGDSLTAPKAAKVGFAERGPIPRRRALKTPTAKPAAPDGASKTQMITAMLSTAGGATSREMETATGWAPHSVRGLLGTMRAKGVKVVSTKLKGEPTIYRIEAQPALEAVGDVV